MSLRRDLRHGRRIARAEFRRSIRRYAQNTRRLVGLGVAVLFFGGYLLLALPAAYAVGLTATSPDAIPLFGAGATAIPVFLLGLAVLRTMERLSRIDAEPLVLLTVHPRAVVVGLVGGELARLGAWFGVPLVAVVAAFALGLGAPALLVSAPLVALPLVCAASTCGYALGLGLLRAFRRLPSLRRVAKAGGVLAMVAVIAGSQFAGRVLVEYGASLSTLASRLTVPPVADYVALALVPTPLGRPPTASALAVGLACLALIPLGLAAATRQASTLWFTDAPTRDATRASSSGWFDVPRPFAWRPAGRIAWSHLVRAARQPQEFAHLVMVLFFLGPIGTTMAESSGDALAVLVAAAGVGLGTYLAGAVFGLNPLGDDESTLPLLLLTERSPGTLVRGRVLAGLAVGLPIAVVVPFASVPFGTAPHSAVALAALGTGTCLAASLFAVGLGCAYPVYEARTFWGTETVVPSTLVMLAYLAVVGAGTLICLAATWFALTGALALTPVALSVAGGYALFTALVSLGSYRYAVRRYRRYTMA
ncbi:hypothetical protein [Haloplanus sp. C73]|uniref:hypothetical protein n=1 Tax=Haloplanus sp. C73 TaxID=3421641 RepID=UPI003EC03F02